MISVTSLVRARAPDSRERFRGGCGNGDIVAENHPIVGRHISEAAALQSSPVNGLSWRERDKSWAKIEVV